MTEATQRPYDDLLPPEARASLLAQYRGLCAERDAAYERAAPHERELAKANAEAEAARLRAEALARKVEEAWGPDHVERKRKIGKLADLLRFIPHDTGAGKAPFRP